jgi:uncharacterized protein (UPF0548 family)
MARGLNCNWHTEAVFCLTKPSAAEIVGTVSAAVALQPETCRFLSLRGGLKAQKLPFLFSHDYSRTCIGHGELAFRIAASAFERWTQFDLGWVQVANPSATIKVGQIVAVEAYTFGLWSLNLSQIVEVEQTPTSLGFVYATTALHVEEGEERFLLRLDPEDGSVWYELEAVSRPQDNFAWLGLPFTRAFQHKFVGDSHRRMREAVLS